MDTPALPGEVLVKNGPANLQRGIETVGGWLTLTDRRLIFESHFFNVRRGATVLSLEEVAGVEAGWTRFLNLIPVFPNALVVTTAGGERYRFTMFGRRAWIDALRARRAALPG